MCFVCVENKQRIQETMELVVNKENIHFHQIQSQEANPFFMVQIIFILLFRMAGFYFFIKTETKPIGVKKEYFDWLQLTFKMVHIYNDF